MATLPTALLPVALSPGPDVMRVSLLSRNGRQHAGSRPNRVQAEHGE